MKKIAIPALLAGAIAIVLLSGCSSMRKGNEDKDVREAIAQVSDRFGIEFKLKKKAKYPGGVLCDVTVSSPDLPGRDIRVFWSMPGEKAVTDYIYQKYGDAAYKRIMDVLSPVVPDAKIVPTEFNYNHFPFQNYDANTTLEDYLKDNDLAIYVFINGDGSRGELRMVFNNCAKALLEAGIDCKELDVFCCKDKSAFNSVKEYPYIPELMEYGGVPLDKTKGEAKSSDSAGLSESMEAYDYDGNVDILIR